MTRFNRRCPPKRPRWSTVGTLAAAVFLLLATQLAATAHAVIITTPPGLNPGDAYRLAFVSSGVRDATSTNIADYNTFIDNAANAVPQLQSLGVDWRVIGSTATVDARTNTGTDPTPAGDTGVPIFLLNGVKLVDHYDDLWDGSLDADLRIDELGNMVPAVQALDPRHWVWTGSSYFGTGQAGSELGGLSGLAVVGSSNINGNDWVDWISDDTFETYHLYGLSDVLVVPEPSSIALAAFGLVALAAWGWRKGRPKS